MVKRARTHIHGRLERYISKVLYFVLGIFLPGYNFLDLDFIHCL